MTDITPGMFKFAKTFVQDFSVMMKVSGKKAKDLGLDREQTMHVWKKVLKISMSGGGKVNEIDITK